MNFKYVSINIFKIAPNFTVHIIRKKNISSKIHIHFVPNPKHNRFFKNINQQKKT